MNYVNLKENIRYLIQNKVPVILYGPPGIGKNYLLEQIAKEEGMEYIVVEGASLVPEDVNGLPIADGNRTKYTPSWILDLIEKAKSKKVLLVIDEVFSSKSDVLAALHGLFHPFERRIGSTKLPDNVHVAGTSNIDGNVQSEDPALINRVAFIGMDGTYIPDNLGLITDFLKANPNLVLVEPKDEYEQFPSLRTYTLLHKVIYGPRELTLKDVEFYAKAFLGAKIANQFVEFYRKVQDKIPKKQMVYKDPVNYFYIMVASGASPREVLFEIRDKNKDGFVKVVKAISNDKRFKEYSNNKEILGAVIEVSKELQNSLKE